MINEVTQALRGRVRKSRDWPEPVRRYLGGIGEWRRAAEVLGLDPSKPRSAPELLRDLLRAETKARML